MLASKLRSHRLLRFLSSDFSVSFSLAPCAVSFRVSVSQCASRSVSASSPSDLPRSGNHMAMFVKSSLSKISSLSVRIQKPFSSTWVS